ncbi:MAG: ABC transporter permease [Chloroflexi bacterium]|nr:MAG: ABC transporter permease [Chloroflexota bacterium]
MSTIEETTRTPKHESPLLAGQSSQSLNEHFQGYMRRLKSGDLGSMPIILGLVVIAIIFQTQNDNFLTPRNFVNLVLQMAGITVIAYGIVFVLLLGEIDLSVGFVSAVGGVGMTILLRSGVDLSFLSFILPDSVISAFAPEGGWAWYVAIPTALLLTAAIGFLHGMIITLFQLPSFVVTLAGLLAWNGVVLILVGQGGTIIIQDRVAVGLGNAFLPDTWGWIVMFGAIGLYALNLALRYRTRTKQGLATKPITLLALQVAVLAVLGIIFVYIANQDRGVPVVGIIMVVWLVVLTFLAERTRFGRYVYAIGGNKEAARRAGIPVERIRVLVFTISGFMAGFGGLILASRLRSVATNAGGGNLLLNAIAAAVIGGTSLFGGRGRVNSAILGALIIASVDNGMGLLGLSSGNKFIITALVLLAAVVIDAVSRRRQEQSGIR